MLSEILLLLVLALLLVLLVFLLRTVDAARALIGPKEDEGDVT